MNLVELVKDAGIVGAGGAGFPTHIKLNAKAEYFIINAAECEPLIETDKYICREYADKLVVAIVATAAHLGASRTVIAIKEKYQPEISALKDAISKSGASIELFLMKSYYPAGDEQIIVQQVTGRSVPERGIPLAVGAVVSNVGTLLGVYNAIDGKSVTRKLLSVVGEVENTIMLDVPLGTPITDCIAQAVPKIDDYRIILGGPMMGKCVTDSEQIKKEVVKKVSGNIIVLPKDHYLFKRNNLPLSSIKHQTRSACIQCRMCTDLCPRYQIGHTIRPHLVMRNLHRVDSISDNSEFTRAFGDAANCCECGICEMFACPMGLSPRKVNIFAKQLLRERAIDVPKLAEPQALSTVDNSKIPTTRLVARLGLSKYYAKHAKETVRLDTTCVELPLSQHIGKPSQPVVSVGDTVVLGQLIATIPENSLGANLHASIAGVVSAVTDKSIIISAKEGI